MDPVQPAIALLVTGIFALLAYALGMVSRSGAVGGLVVGTLVYLSLGPEGFAVLALFVVGGSTLTRLGYGSKRRRGAAQEAGGRRGAKNALANCTVAVVCAGLASTTGSAVFGAAFVAALGAAFADTVESEVGQLARRRPRLVTDLRPVPPGTDGAVSLPGTLAGCAAAGLTAVVGLWVGLVAGAGAALVVGVAAFVGTIVDSLIGAVAPRVGNEVTNVVCTLSAAGLTVVLLGLL